MNFKRPRKVNSIVLDEVRRLPCCVCGRAPVDPSHIRSRGSGGPDDFFNVAPHCRRHHSEWHQLGWAKFIERHPQMLMWLRRKGWEVQIGFTPGNNELWHPNLSRDDAP